MADVRSSDDRLAAGKVKTDATLTAFLFRLFGMTDDELREASVRRAAKSYPAINPNWLAEYISRERNRRGMAALEWQPVEWTEPEKPEAPELPPPMAEREFATYWGPDMEPCPHGLAWPKNCVPCATAMQRVASPIPVGRRHEVVTGQRRRREW